jgi:hypothetical protein
MSVVERTLPSLPHLDAAPEPVRTGRSGLRRAPCALDIVVLAGTIPAVVTRATRSALGRGEVLAEGRS